MIFFNAGDGAGVKARDLCEGVADNSFERAILAAGCFWGVEARLRRVEGVQASEVGYTGGASNAPTYAEVCRGKSGHAEACALAFDAKQLDFEALLEIFWRLHDPTQVERQGADVGNQYRSAIFVLNETQRRKAEASRASAQKRFPIPIATEITPASKFWRAEEYHQRYIDKRHGLRKDEQASARVF